MTQTLVYSDFLSELQVIRALVDQETQRLLTSKASPRLTEAMRYSSLAKAKRIRAFLLVATADMFAIPRQQSVRAATAVELVHTYSLIHDDLPAMDNASRRRDQLSSHMKYDEATAILAGNALLSLAFEVLADEQTHPSAVVRSEMVLHISKATGFNGMMAGQMWDILSEGKAMSITKLEEMLALKTGKLIAASMVIGGLLAQAKPVEISSLNKFGQHLGTLFQIVDDLLDTSANAKELGKPVGQNLQASKATFVTKLGSNKAQDIAANIHSQAVKELEVFGVDANLLRMAANFILNRNW